MTRDPFSPGIYRSILSEGGYRWVYYVAETSYCHTVHSGDRSVVSGASIWWNMHICVGELLSYKHRAVNYISFCIIQQWAAGKLFQSEVDISSHSTFSACSVIMPFRYACIESTSFEGGKVSFSTWRLCPIFPGWISLSEVGLYVFIWSGSCGKPLLRAGNDVESSALVAGQWLVDDWDYMTDTGLIQ